MHRKSILQHVAAACLVAASAAGPMAPAQAQTAALHLLGTGQLQVPPPQHQTSLPRGALHRAAPTPDLGNFVLRKVMIDGSSSASLAALEQAVAPAIGHRVNGADLQLIAQRIGIAEAQAGIALYGIDIPSQKIRHGILHVRVTEVSVIHVYISGTDNNGRLSLLRSYAQHILASRPLRRDVLERNILLMGDIAGGKVASRFVIVAGHPDQENLVLIVRQTKFFGGFSVNNQGSPLLYNTQAVFNAGVNNLFHEGERTQFVLGLPPDVTRYQFYGLNDIEPIGGNGISLALTAGELLSHPQGADRLSGAAAFGSAELSDPVLRSVHRNATVSTGLDYLDSSDAFLGFTSSDERTRAVHVSVAYNDDKYFNGVDRADASLTEGLDILGARQAGIAYGPPSFTKGAADIERFQVLPKNFVLRLGVGVQFTADRLPPSQEFEYGGTGYGLAFYTAELAGDEGAQGIAELSHPIPAGYLPKALQGSAAFTSVDYGRIWNRDPIYVPATDRAASFAAGVKFMLLQKVQLELGAATPLIEPRTIGGNQHWRFVIATSGQF
jgi:hemolysin activation/secretion protein